MSLFSSRRACGSCTAPVGAVLPLLAALLLGGCVTTGSEESSAPPAAQVAARRSAQQCAQEVVGKPDYAPLHAKVYFGTDDVGARPYLANRDRPAATETVLLDAMNGELRECRQLALSEAPSSRATKLAESHRAEDKLWSEAATGRLTWGQFNQRRRTIAAHAQALLTAPAPAVTAAPRQDLFALDPPRSDDAQMRWRGSREPRPGATITIDSMNQSGSTYCGAMRHTAYCDPRR